MRRLSHRRTRVFLVEDRRYTGVTGMERASKTLRPMETSQLIALTATIFVCAAPSAFSRPA